MTLSSSNRASAFSFTDLLVTVAALMLLSAITLPVLTRIKAKSRMETCSANLHQIGQAVLSYAKDNQDTMPTMVDKTPGGWWWYKDQVKSYAGIKSPGLSQDKLFACPSDRGYEESGGEKGIPFYSSRKHNYTSYVLNGVNLHGMPNIAARQISSINMPARTLMVMEWTAHAPLSWHNSLTGRANSPFYKDAQSMVAFVDGHVKFIKIYYDGINAAYTRDPVPGYEYKYSAD